MLPITSIAVPLERLSIFTSIAKLDILENNLDGNFIGTLKGKVLSSKFPNIEIDKKLVLYDFQTGIRKTVKWYLENKTFLKSISKKQHEKRFGLNI